MENLFLRIPGITVTWHGETQRTDQEGKIIKRYQAQGYTIQDDGKPFHYEFGGNKALLEMLVVDQVIVADVKVRGFNNGVFVDIQKFSRVAGSVPPANSKR
jgi:hypothetical protein